MYLVQFFIPVFGQQGNRFSRCQYEQVERELVNRFEGYTAYSCSPDDRSQLQVDELIIYEVITDRQDRPWWTDYRHSLEQRFQQKQILIRSLVIDVF
jgi:hypothetical protein